MGLQAIRMQRKMAADTLAKKSGISQASISRIERGKQNPRISVIVALAKALGCKVEELIEPDPAEQERQGA